MSNRDKAKVKEGPKHRGLFNIPYEVLEDWLGLRPGSIRAVSVRPERECIEVIHDDEAPGRATFAMYPGSEIPRNTLKYDKMGHPLKEKSPPA